MEIASCRFLLLGHMGEPGESLRGRQRLPGLSIPSFMVYLPLQGSHKAKAVSFRMETPLSAFQVQPQPWIARGNENQIPLLELQSLTVKEELPSSTLCGVSGNEALPELSEAPAADVGMGSRSAEGKTPGRLESGKDAVG